MEVSDLIRDYDELLPWDKVRFIDWIKTREEFEIEGSDLDDMEISIDDVGDHFTDHELLDACDTDSIVDYIFDHGLEDNVIDQYNEDELSKYLQESCPDVVKRLALDDLTDQERDRIFQVAYRQGYIDHKNGKKNFYDKDEK